MPFDPLPPPQPPGASSLHAHPLFRAVKRRRCTILYALMTFVQLLPPHIPTPPPCSRPGSRARPRARARLTPATRAGAQLPRVGGGVEPGGPLPRHRQLRRHRPPLEHPPPGERCVCARARVRARAARRCTRSAPRFCAILPLLPPRPRRAAAPRLVARAVATL